MNIPGDSFETLVADFEQSAPAIVPRDELRSLGWPWSPRTMANLASLRKGPTAFKAGGRVVYRRESLVRFLREKLREGHGDV